MKINALLSTSALCSVALVGATLSVATPAFGQDAVPADDPAATTTTGTPETISALPQDEATETLPDAQGQAVEETIVITGSRIRRSEFTSPDPIQIIDPQISRNQGQFDTASMIQSSPIAAGSTQITSAISSNFVTNGGPGAQTISLRGLGAERTLVLLNGRRAGPAGTRGGVSSFDLNVLPQSIVSRVEVLKTGASSIYGSDAVAGLVNLITKVDTDGLQLDFTTGIPFKDGGEQFRASALWGKDFGRGHIMFAVDYFKQKELKRGDRKYLDCAEGYLWRPGYQERADLIDPRTGNYKCEEGTPWGQVWTYDLEYLYGLGPGNLILPDGTHTGSTTLMQFQYPGETLGIPTYDGSTGFGMPAGWFPVGYDGPSNAVLNEYHQFMRDSTIIPETDLYTAYAQGAYEITDNVEAFFELLHNHRKTYQNGWRQIWQFGYTSDLYGTGFGDPLAEGWTGFNLISPTGITDQSDNYQKVDYTRAVGGLRGDFGSMLEGWSWDSYVQYSRSNGRYYSQQVLNDAMATQDFRTASCVGTTTPVSNKPCVDVRWTDPYFLRGEMTQAELDFLFDWERGKTLYTQLVGEVSMSGDLFTLPAGPVGMAIGATYRRDKINDTPGDITLADNAWNTTGAGITAGKSDTKEAFAELNVPLIHNTPGIREFTLSAAGRLTNVKATRASDGFSDSDNGNWTYKLGANWQVNDWLRFRGSYGTSFRAPALFEQFLADQTSSLSQRSVDPCIQWGVNLANGGITQQVADNCAADGVPQNHIGGGVSATIVTGGGIGVLDPETSRAWTASVILTPRFAFLPDTSISLAVDYFDIEVKGEITQLGAFNIVYGCYSSEFFPNDPLCDLFERGQTGAPNNIANVRDSFININDQRNSGVDVTANIRQDLGSWGNLSFLAQMTWQTKDTVALFAGTEVSNNGEDGEPKWVGDFNLVWNAPNDWTLFYGLDVVGATSDERDYIVANGNLCPNYVGYGEVCLDLTAPSKFYHSASVTKEFGRFEITAGVSNLFDTRPPRVSILNGAEISTLGQSIVASQYDFFGRRFFLSGTARF